MFCLLDRAYVNYCFFAVFLLDIHIWSRDGTTKQKTNTLLHNTHTLIFKLNSTLLLCFLFYMHILGTTRHDTARTHI